METKPTRVVKNSDNDSLLPSGGKGLRIGYVDEVNGAGAEEVAGYVPTRHEVVELVKHWYARALDNSWFSFVYGQTGSQEWRLNKFAEMRIDRAAEAVGKGAVDQAIKEAREEFRKKVDNPRLWDIFENGTQAQRDAVPEEAYGEMREQDAAECLKKLERLERKFPGDFVALVLCSSYDDRYRPVVVCPTESELSAVLKAAGTFEVETDRSRIRTLMVDQHLPEMGFLRATRQDVDWRFDF